MAIRIRKDGTMWCAAHTEEMPGDTYIDDGLHYEMSVMSGVIVALPMPEHVNHPQWWWAGNASEGADMKFSVNPASNNQPQQDADRSCTCHPDDRTTGPCKKKYAASECQQPADKVDAQLAAEIHYPQCWDTAAYPTLTSALWEMCGDFHCTNDECAQPTTAMAGEALKELDALATAAKLSRNVTIVDRSVATVRAALSVQPDPAMAGDEPTIPPDQIQEIRDESLRVLEANVCKPTQPDAEKGNSNV